jgi:hypothetical protein
MSNNTRTTPPNPPIHKYELNVGDLVAPKYAKIEEELFVIVGARRTTDKEFYQEGLFSYVWELGTINSKHISYGEIVRLPLIMTDSIRYVR